MHRPGACMDIMIYGIILCANLSQFAVRQAYTILLCGLLNIKLSNEVPLNLRALLIS